MRKANDLLNRLERRFGRVALGSRPVEVIIEPTNKCNSRCAMCLPYRQDANLSQPESGFMQWETLRAAQSVLRTARRVLLCGFGEPLLHPDYLEMMAWVKSQTPYAYFFTNGTLITPEVAESLVRLSVDQVVFSMGGTSNETFKKVRGIGIARVLAGLSALASAKGRLHATKPEMAFNVVAMNSVLPELSTLISLAKEYGVSSISMPQLWVESPAMRAESVFLNPEAQQFIAAASDEAALKNIQFHVYDYPPTPRLCDSPFKTMSVAYNGDVFSCPGERYVMGNVLETPVTNIWRSEGFVELRRRLITQPDGICPSCPSWTGLPETFMNPAIHGRELGENFRNGDGPQKVHSERVCGENIGPE